MSDSFQIEMLWKCRYCTVKKINRGRDMACVECGKPKDDTVEYFMPEDIEKAEVITDAPLLKMALAGENWKCKYCSSDQRRNNGECAQCGAEERADSPFGKEDAPLPAEDEKPASTNFAYAPKKVNATLLGAVAIGILFIVGIVWAFIPKEVRGEVVETHWQNIVHVQRKSLFNHESFQESIPSGAINVNSLGNRFHHNDRVYDHTDQVPYSVEVPDGFRTENYTAKEACGQNCIPVPRTCVPIPRNCTSNKNGFATCTGGGQSCSGGGQSCSTKYCDVPKTRQIPKTRPEIRYRAVRIDRDEPRYEPWYSWSAWEWRNNRDIIKEGNDNNMIWPSNDEIKLNAYLGVGEEESESKESRYSIVFSIPQNKIIFEPKSESDFKQFNIHDHYKIKMNGFGITEMHKE